MGRVGRLTDQIRALHIQKEALDAEDPDQKVRLAGAMHRLGRELRQAVALQVRTGQFATEWR